MKKRYPISKRPGQHNNHSIVPITTPNIQIPNTLGVLTEGPKQSNRNVAGQIYTRIDMQDQNGNKMTIHQRQQILNLVNNTTNSFYVGGDSNNRHNYRRNRYVKR